MNIPKELWETVRKWYNYPPLREPILEEEVEGGAHFNFSSSDIKVGKNYVESVKEKTKLPEEKCLEGLLTHEVGHYMVFPRNLATIILSGKMLDDFFKESEVSNFIYQTYSDICTDVVSVMDENKREPILGTRTASQEIIPDELNRNIREVILGYLHKQASRKYTLKPELKSYLETMLTIEFLDPETSRPFKDIQKLRLSLFRFGDLINDMIKKYKQDETEVGLNQNGLGMQNPEDINIDEIVKRASSRDIREAMREISEKITRGEYKKLREWLEKKRAQLPKETKGESIGIGTSKGELRIDQEVVNYYREFSKLFPLIVSKKPIEIEKTKKAFEETEKWRVGKEPLLAIPHTSGGMFLPGITRKIRIKDRNIKTTDYDLPHLLVAMDSSGSMPDPAYRKSHAVLAGFCAARSYYLNESAIGVINFSGDSFYLPYTRNLEEALGAICAYQGGGTSVDLGLLKKMLRPEKYKLYEGNPEAHIGRVPKEAIKKEIELSSQTFKKALESGSIDLLMFTDGGIANLEEVLQFFEEVQALNRATIVLTHHYDQFIPPTTRPKVTIYRIDKEEDIPHIVLKDIRRNLNYRATRYQTQSE